jgi:hypothetical protein
MRTSKLKWTEGEHRNTKKLKDRKNDNEEPAAQYNWLKIKIENENLNGRKRIRMN